MGTIFPRGSMMSRFFKDMLAMPREKHGQRFRKSLVGQKVPVTVYLLATPA
jgi:hypothetical protein